MAWGERHTLLPAGYAIRASPSLAQGTALNPAHTARKATQGIGPGARASAGNTDCARYLQGGGSPVGAAIAGDAARLHHDGGRQPTDALAGSCADTSPIDTLGVLKVEPGIPAATVAMLRAMGHNVEVETTGIPFGGYQIIARDPVTGIYSGATEMRKDGQAAGY